MATEEKLSAANKRITDLLNDIERLSEELKRKDCLLEKALDVGFKQSQQISSFAMAPQDTVVWDPVTCPQPSCSTPVSRSTWADVVILGEKRRRSPGGISAAPCVSLSNRFSVLAEEALTGNPSPRATTRHPLPQQVGASCDVPVTGPPVPGPSQVSGSRTTKANGAWQQRKPPREAAAYRRKLLRDAVIRRSGGLTRPESAASPPHSDRRSDGGSHCPEPAESPAQSASCSGGSSCSETVRPPHGSASTDPPAMHLSSQSLSPAPGQNVIVPPGHGTRKKPLAAQSPPSPPAMSAQPTPAAPKPLFSPTTIIVGDSIIRHCRFFNATTHCLPGANARSLLEELPALLQSAAPSVNRIIVHVGTNDTALRHSEKTKDDFKLLFSYLYSCGLSVFISGPIPTQGRGSERFSRILQLNSFLQSLSCSFSLGFIDNCNLFWSRPTLYKPDGLHPTSLGSKFLLNNIRYAVQTHSQP